ncbi:MAG: arsenate reductase ArsC [Mariniblastus sp.]|nr:arsenate reductase ArsC [Mariniblastus sp.]
MAQRILILCTGNSCRSQMAQVIWQDLAGDQVLVESAGSDPAGYVHPLAIQALQELELPTEGLVSKSLTPLLDQPIDLAVTVCDHAQQSCPSLPHVKNRLHWPFDDPADAEGTDEEKMQLFRRVRDEIRERVTEYLASQQGSAPPSP